ncbi:MAG: NYN domain-containing protein [Clostridia bacterium]|nr:NYN domain-containing protein [Clostridia bacterium]
MENFENNSKIAILIDAENISYKNTQQIIETMEQKGKILVKMVVADWTKITGSQTKTNGKYVYRTKQIDGWRTEASRHSMTAVQQFSYVVGKNTSDIALTIQAMKILYEKPYITTFCLVSNDSDFTRLAQELREQNKEVIGMGERSRAIQEFVNAFSEFIYLGESIEEENLDLVQEPVQEEIKVEKVTKDKAEDNPTPQKSSKSKKKNSKKKNAKKDECFLGQEKLNALKKIIENDIESSDESVAYYSSIGNRMKSQFADFIPANYDCKKISQLMAKILPYLPEYVEHKEPIPNNPHGYLMMLKRK